MRKLRKFWESKGFWCSPQNLLKSRIVFDFRLSTFIKMGEFLDNDYKHMHTSMRNLENNNAKMRNCSTKFSWNFEAGAVQKRVNLLDLVKSFRSSVYYLLAQFDFDAAENETLKVCQQLAKSSTKVRTNIARDSYFISSTERKWAGQPSLRANKPYQTVYLQQGWSSRTSKTWLANEMMNPRIDDFGRSALWTSQST